jgi:hypothetical protein
MKKLVLTTFAAAMIAAPVLADIPLDFKTDGHHIVGVVDQVGDTQIIKGKDVTSGQSFELRVRKGYVQGNVGSQYVSFPAPKRKLNAATPG